MLELLERKPRAAAEATVIRQMGLPPCFEELRVALRRERRQSDREWVQVLGLLVEHPLESLRSAVVASLDSGAPGLGSIRQLLRIERQPRLVIEPVQIDRPSIASITVAAPDLSQWSVLHAGALV